MEATPLLQSFHQLQFGLLAAVGKCIRPPVGSDQGRRANATDAGRIRRGNAFPETLLPSREVEDVDFPRPGIFGFRGCKVQTFPISSPTDHLFTRSKRSKRTRRAASHRPYHLLLF